MRSADIWPGQHYVWWEREHSTPRLVEILEIYVERPVASSVPRLSRTRNATKTSRDGVRIRVADPQDYRFDREELVLPRTIVSHVSDPEQWLRERAEREEERRRKQQENEEREARWRAVHGQREQALAILEEAGVQGLVLSYEPEVRLSGEAFFKLVEHLEDKGERKGWARAHAKGGS